MKPDGPGRRGGRRRQRRRALDRSVGGGQYTVVRTEAVRPRSARAAGKALTPFLLSFVVTLIYLAVPLRVALRLAAVVATAHDVIATIAFMQRDAPRSEPSSWWARCSRWVGYSLNDTIIIFDRVRETCASTGARILYEILNLSINETCRARC